MELNEINKSVKSLLNDRLRSPFYSAFIVSWLGWNWRIFYYLLCDDSSLRIVDRLNIIEIEYVGLNQNLFFPLVTSLIVLILGSVFNIVFRFIQLRFTNFRRSKIEGMEMLSVEESKNIKKKSIEDENSIQHSLLLERERLEALRASYGDKLKQWENLTKINEGLQEELNELRMKLNDFVVKRSQLQDTKGSHIVLNRSFLADSNSKVYETIDSQVLKSNSGSVLIWACVSAIIHDFPDKTRFKYLIAHSTNNGESLRRGDFVYPNAWSISRKTGPSPEWRFWCSDENGSGQDIILRSTSELPDGWHLFCVAWSMEHNFIKFFIDDKIVDSREFSFWPQQFDIRLFVGTWPNRFVNHFFSSEVGPVITSDEALPLEEVSELFKKGH